jgi:hypothetical protein
MVSNAMGGIEGQHSFRTGFKPALLMDKTRGRGDLLEVMIPGGRAILF